MSLRVLRTVAPLVALFSISFSVFGEITINEILANNKDRLNPDGSISDWVELYNPASQAVSLTGYSLTDSASDPRKWVFPANVTIPANGLKLVLLDSSRSASSTAATLLNTGFSPKATGDRIELYTSSTQLVESVRFGPQAANFSIGRPAPGRGFILCTPTPESSNVAQGLGAPTDLHINEWMASPSSGKDWFEIYNSGALPVQLTDLYFTDDGNSPSPVAPLSYIGVDLYAYLRIFANNSTNDNEVDFKLSGSGDSISLFTSAGARIDGVSFGQQTADISEGRLPDGSNNKKPLSVPTPGDSNVIPYPGLIVNELLSHTDPPLEDAVEFYNQNDSPINISGWYLSNQRTDLLKFRVPDGTIVKPKDFVVFYEYQFGKNSGPNGFTFNSAHGDQVYLAQVNSVGELTGYVVSETFESAAHGVSFGHYETSVAGDYKFVAMEKLTFGAPDNVSTLEQFRSGKGASNSPPLVGPIVINEIMYHPQSTALDGSDNQADEFIELKNITGQDVLLYDPAHNTNHWRLQSAVGFDFPLGSKLPASSYALVVSFDPNQDAAQLATFRTKYTVPAGVQIFGPYSGKLNNGGDAIELYRPDPPQESDRVDAGYVPYIRVDKVNYRNGAPWTPDADATGKSLQRKNSTEFGNDPKNWEAATPTAGNPNSAEVADSDGDGMPDVWETQHGFDPKNKDDAALDADNDGFSNLQEYIAGTDPRDATSRLGLEIVSYNSTVGTALVIATVPGKSYTIESRSSLEPSTPWQKLKNIDAVASQTTFQDANSAGKAERFYRVLTPSYN